MINSSPTPRSLDSGQHTAPPLEVPGEQTVLRVEESPIFYPIWLPFQPTSAHTSPSHLPILSIKEDPFLYNACRSDGQSLLPNFNSLFPHCAIIPSNKVFPGLPWWSSGKESTCQCGRHRFNPWSRKISHAAQQLSPCAVTIEAVLFSPGAPTTESMCNYRSPHTPEPINTAGE